jgi:hypothetical protein
MGSDVRIWAIATVVVTKSCAGSIVLTGTDEFNIAVRADPRFRTTASVSVRVACADSAVDARVIVAEVLCRASISGE